MSVETIAVVGRGPGAEQVATTLTAAGVTVLRLDPHMTSLTVLNACDLVVACDLIADAAAAVDQAPLALLRALEDHMTHGSILVAAGVNGHATTLAEGLRRPDQFLALDLAGGRVELAPSERTAPGALWAVRSFLGSALGEPPPECIGEDPLRRAG